MPELELLEKKLSEQRSAFKELKEETSQLGGSDRRRVQAWLASIYVMIEQLEKCIMALGKTPGRRQLDAAWSRLWDLIAALSSGDVRDVAKRLRLVSWFLALQITAAALLVGYTVWVFRHFDPQTALTRSQWEERRVAQEQVRRVLRKMQAAATTPAAAPAPANAAPTAAAGSQPEASSQAGASTADQAASPEIGLLRAEVEALASTFAESKLAQSDIDRAKPFLDDVLSDLDASPPAFADAARSLEALVSALAASDANEPPQPFPTIVLGSLLGMITITTHLNWKYVDRWNTVHFLAWYITKLVGAPVISLAAIGLLFQVSFSGELPASGGLSGLGLRGASPMLLFAVSILTGLFSNRVFDWLRQMARVTAGTGRPAAGKNGRQAPAADASGPGDDEAG